MRVKSKARVTSRITTVGMQEVMSWVVGCMSFFRHIIFLPKAPLVFLLPLIPLGCHHHHHQHCQPLVGDLSLTWLVWLLSKHFKTKPSWNVYHQHLCILLWRIFYFLCPSLLQIILLVRHSSFAHQVARGGRHKFALLPVLSGHQEHCGIAEHYSFAEMHLNI